MNIAIVTKNAIHGGVESLISMHQKHLGAKVIVAGGLNSPDTCPFEYTFVENPEQLIKELEGIDVISYHWPPDWAVDAIKRSGLPCVETVHRVDTAECDKSVPTRLIVHSEFLKEFLKEKYNMDSVVIHNSVDVGSFPENPSGKYIGGLTSYYDTKGIDLFILAWSKLAKEFPEQRVRFYGAGQEMPKYEQMIKDLALTNIELLPATDSPQQALKEFSLFIAPSRIEGMPVAILEALASNIPVICSDLEGMVEFNKLAESRNFPAPLILCKTENVEDLAEKIRQALIEQPTSQSRAYMLEFFDVKQHCAQLKKILAEAIEMHNQQAKEKSSTEALGTGEYYWLFGTLNNALEEISRIRQTRAFRLMMSLKQMKQSFIRGERSPHDILTPLEDSLRLMLKRLSERSG